MKFYPHRQMSESFITAAFLSVSGGLQDAYTYIFRGKVFANAHREWCEKRSLSITQVCVVFVSIFYHSVFLFACKPKNIVIILQYIYSSIGIT